MLHNQRRVRLATLALAATVAAASLPAAARAEPGGCLKYGAAGAVGGHLAHHHAVIGAAGGCAVGMYRRHKYRKAQRQKARAYDQEHRNDSPADSPSEPPHS